MQATMKLEVRWSLGPSGRWYSEILLDGMPINPITALFYVSEVDLADMEDVALAQAKATFAAQEAAHVA